VITVVDYKGIGIDEVELNSVVLLCGVTMFYKCHASALPALSRLWQVGLYSLIIAPPFLSGCP